MPAKTGLYVRNPTSGRLIRKGGPVFLALKAKGRAPSGPAVRKRRASARHPDLAKARVYRHLPHRASHVKSRRGSKGWARVAPSRTGSTRATLRQKCGRKCFLLPRQLGFPVCPTYTGPASCRVDCRGVRAALTRAAQWHYPNVQASARALGKRAHCRWAEQ
jgi:hypothetical protein